MWGITAAVGCALGWLAGSAGEVRIIQEFCLVGMIISALWSLLGRRALRRMALPLGLLIFLVPFGDSLISPLQDFTATFAAAALRFSGVPTFIDGRLITVPTGDWQVAEACSGISYLISMIVLACLFAALAYRTWWRRALLLLAGFVIPIVANGIRAYGIIMLAYFSNNRLAVGVDHIIYGSIFFVFVIFLLFSIASRWREPITQDVPTVTRLSRQAHSERPCSRSALLISSVVPVFLAAVVALVPSLVWGKDHSAVAVASAPSISAPWTLAVDNGWQPVVTSETEFTASYSNPDRQTVNVFIHRYALDAGGIELASGSNPLLAGGDTTVWAPQYRIVLLNRRPESVNENVALVGSGRRLVWSWYSVAGADTAEPLRVKLLQAKARLFSRGSAGQLTVVSIQLQDFAYDRKLLQEFLDSASF